MVECQSWECEGVGDPKVTDRNDFSETIEFECGCTHTLPVCKVCLKGVSGTTNDVCYACQPTFPCPLCGDSFI